MTATSSCESCEFYDSLPRPVLLLSSRAGRGNVSIAEAIHEHFTHPENVYHRSIEDFLEPGMVSEDLHRYEFISNHVPVLLAAPYKVPFFYYRKLLRERLRRTELSALQQFLKDRAIASVVCVSHRQAFWTSVVKRNASLDVSIYGVLTEFGPSLGWKYIFWDQMAGYVSPVSHAELDGIVPNTVPFKHLPLPARSLFHSLPPAEDPKRNCLVMGGLWGQGQVERSVDLMMSRFPSVRLHVVCGSNRGLEERLRQRYPYVEKLMIHGLLDSVAPLLARCGCVITKPGMGTLLEAQAARRKIFLFRGMPVAESHNARYAIEHFGAEWLSAKSFGRWRWGDERRTSV